MAPEEVMSISYPRPSARSWKPFCVVGQYATGNGRIATHESTLGGRVVATQKGLFGEVYSNLLSNGDVCEEHELDRDRVSLDPQVKSDRYTVPPEPPSWRRWKWIEHSR